MQRNELLTWKTEYGKQESKIRDLWDNIKRANLHIIGIPEVEKHKGMENIFEEIIAVNFPNLKDTDIKIQEEQRTPKQVELKQAHTKTFYNTNGRS